MIQLRKLFSIKCILFKFPGKLHIQKVNILILKDIYFSKSNLPENLNKIPFFSWWEYHNISFLGCWTIHPVCLSEKSVTLFLNKGVTLKFYHVLLKTISSVWSEGMVFFFVKLWKFIKKPETKRKNLRHCCIRDGDMAENEEKKITLQYF